jgi:hypothetical protein
MTIASILAVTMFRNNLSMYMFFVHIFSQETRGSAVGWGTMLQAGRFQIRSSTRLLNYFNLPNPSSCTMALGFTQTLTKISMYQKMFLGVNRGRRIRLTIPPPSVSRLSRKCEILDNLKPYKVHCLLQGELYYYFLSLLVLLRAHPRLLLQQPLYIHAHLQNYVVQRYTNSFPEYVNYFNSPTIFRMA